MKRGVRKASIIGGVGLLLIDAAGIWRGKLPLKGRFDTNIDLAENPDIFLAYAVGLGVIGSAAIAWGLMRQD